MWTTKRAKNKALLVSLALLEAETALLREENERSRVVKTDLDITNKMKFRDFILFFPIAASIFSLGSAFIAIINILFVSKGHLDTFSLIISQDLASSSALVIALFGISLPIFLFYLILYMMEEYILNDMRKNKGIKRFIYMSMSIFAFILMSLVFFSMLSVVFLGVIFSALLLDFLYKIIPHEDFLSILTNKNVKKSISNSIIIIISMVLVSFVSAIFLSKPLIYPYPLEDIRFKGIETTISSMVISEDIGTIKIVNVKTGFLLILDKSDISCRDYQNTTNRLIEKTLFGDLANVTSSEPPFDPFIIQNCNHPTDLQKENISYVGKPLDWAVSNLGEDGYHIELSTRDEEGHIILNEEKHKWIVTSQVQDDWNITLEAQYAPEKTAAIANS